MKTPAILIAAAFLASSSLASAKLALRCYVTHEKTSTLVDVVADISDCELRSFGIQLQYNPKLAELQSVGRYGGIWYFADEKGQRVPYSEPQLDEPGIIRMVGGRLDGRTPDSGVSGSGILLGTFVFQRQTEQEPSFALGLAYPAPFANFVSIDGKSLDGEVELEKEPTIEPPSEDEDQDGLPDHYEREVFGSLDVSDGEGSDTDGDGINDYQEWLAGSDPTDKESNIDLKLEPQSDGSIMLEWATMDGRVYDLEWSMHPGKFAPIVEGLTGANQLVDNTERVRGFYRLRVRNPRFHGSNLP